MNRTAASERTAMARAVAMTYGIAAGAAREGIVIRRRTRQTWSPSQARSGFRRSTSARGATLAGTGTRRQLCRGSAQRKTIGECLQDHRDEGGRGRPACWSSWCPPASRRAPPAHHQYAWRVGEARVRQSPSDRRTPNEALHDNVARDRAPELVAAHGRSDLVGESQPAPNTRHLWRSLPRRSMVPRGRRHRGSAGAVREPVRRAGRRSAPTARWNYDDGRVAASPTARTPRSSARSVMPCVRKAFRTRRSCASLKLPRHHAGAVQGGAERQRDHGDGRPALACPARRSSALPASAWPRWRPDSRQRVALRHERLLEHASMRFHRGADRQSRGHLLRSPSPWAGLDGG